MYGSIFHISNSRIISLIWKSLLPPNLIIYRMKFETFWENISRVLCPLVNIAAATKTAFETLEGNNSIMYDIHAPPKSCPTNITCINFKNENKQVRYIIHAENPTTRLGPISDSNKK